MELFDMMFEKNEEQKRLQDVCTGLMLGTVKKNWDQKHKGMLMVELTLGEEGKSTTGWVPVLQSYAGKNYGTYFLPEVSSVVVVGFLQGKLDCPVVLGCLWDKVNTLPTDAPTEKNSIKEILTKNGHRIIFDEKKDDEKITIQSKGQLTVQLEDKEQIITIKDKSGENLCRINGKKGEISIEAKKKLSLKVGGKAMLTLDGSAKKLAVEADNIDIKAGQALKIKGQSTKLEGNMVELKAQGSFKAQAGAMMEIKGAMTKLQ